MNTTFYDKGGNPICYTEDSVHIYSFSGVPLAYFHQDSIYSFDGQHLAWCVDGWLRDHSGLCILFTKEAKGGPAKPGCFGLPGKAGRLGLSGKSGRQAKPARPALAVTWSGISAAELFPALQ